MNLFQKQRQHWIGKNENESYKWFFHENRRRTKSTKRTQKSHFSSFDDDPLFMHFSFGRLCTFVTLANDRHAKIGGPRNMRPTRNYNQIMFGVSFVRMCEIIFRLHSFETLFLFRSSRCDENMTDSWNEAMNESITFLFHAATFRRWPSGKYKNKDMRAHKQCFREKKSVFFFNVTIISVLCLRFSCHLPLIS